MTRKGKISFGQLGVRFTDRQATWVRDQTPATAIIGGFGSGKTLPFCMKAITLSLLNGRGYRGILVSPTHEMFQRTLLPTLRDDIMSNVTEETTGRTLWDLSTYSPSRKELTFPWGFTYYFGSADRPDKLRGPNLAVAGVDEATLIKDFGRIAVALESRLRRGRVYQFFCNGTPEGLDAVYEKFCVPPRDPAKREQWQDSHKLTRISTLDNPGVPQSFVDQLLLTLSEEQAKAYVYGEHVDIGRGLAYYNFNDDLNVRRDAVYDPFADLHISWDFNISPMSCSISQVRGGVLYTIGEISLNNSNTPEVCREIIRRYGGQGERHQRNVYVYGDASAKVGTNQYDEIEDWLSPAFVGRVIRRVPSANPRHNARLKSVNGLFRNAVGTVRWIIHPSCSVLLRDLKTQRMEANGISKDKRQVGADGNSIGHMSDTTDYLIDQLFPYRFTGRQRADDKTKMLDHLHS